MLPYWVEYLLKYYAVNFTYIDKFCPLEFGLISKTLSNSLNHVGLSL